MSTPKQKGAPAGSVAEPGTTSMGGYQAKWGQQCQHPNKKVHQRAAWLSRVPRPWVDIKQSGGNNVNTQTKRCTSGPPRWCAYAGRHCKGTVVASQECGSLSKPWMSVCPH